VAATAAAVRHPIIMRAILGSLPAVRTGAPPGETP
jgi:hypothetical protein